LTSYNTFTPKRPIIVNTFNPEEEIWHYLGKLLSEKYVRDLLNKRLENSFFGLDFYSLQENKKNKEYTEVYRVLSQRDIDNNAIEITHLTRQAIEIYRASQTVSLYSKPILLYYCYLRLTRILFLSTYTSNYNKVKGSDTHGLEFTQENEAKCMMAGAFPRFHDSFLNKPSIYIDEHKFKWQDFLSPPTDRFFLFRNMEKGNYFVKIKATKPDIEDYKIHELAREILFAYAMSMLARYRVLDWSKIIEGRDSNNLVWKIGIILDQHNLSFPI
jgi:YaaC-like protein